PPSAEESGGQEDRGRQPVLAQHREGMEIVVGVPVVERDADAALRGFPALPHPPYEILQANDAMTSREDLRLLREALERSHEVLEEGKAPESILRKDAMVGEDHGPGRELILFEPSQNSKGPGERELGFGPGVGQILPPETRKRSFFPA